jgi:hypothetical protein
MRPKNNGGWLSPFDPKEVNNNYTEGNSWQYSFFVPQDIPGMIAAYGGKQRFEAKLDEMFSGESKTTGREQVDVTGLIGQYAHGNEPSHHMAYLYNYVGKPEKTTEKVHFILNDFYKNEPDGLIGNEDCGQMSAWYVLSAMGIYAVTPGNPEWSLTKPYFDSIKVNFEDGTSRKMENHQGFQKYFGLDHRSEIAASQYQKINPVPVIHANSKSFKDKMTIAIDDFSKNKIFYSFTNTNDFKEYVAPFEIEKSVTVYCYSIDESNVKSTVVSSTFFKKPNNWTVAIHSKFNPQYTAGGNEGIIDGIRGTENWKKGDWQGYQSQDFECVIDLQKEQKITELSADFLQDSRSWILMPKKVEFYTSKDNVNFTLVKTIENELDPKEYDTKISDFKGTVKPTAAKYIKVIAYNYGKLPLWHQGYGGDAFIFVDEITVK